jgi:hypothetical protein
VETWEGLRELGYNWLDVGWRHREADKLVWVIAKLVLKSRIIRADNGVIRAEMAYPKKVYIPAQHWRLLKPIRKGYGCGVGIIDRFSGTGTTP